MNDANSMVGASGTWSFPPLEKGKTPIFLIRLSYIIDVEYESTDNVDQNADITAKSGADPRYKLSFVKDSKVVVGKKIKAKFDLTILKESGGDIDLTFGTTAQGGTDGVLTAKFLIPQADIVAKSVIVFEETFVKDIGRKNKSSSTLDINLVSNGQPIPWAFFLMQFHNGEKCFDIYPYNNRDVASKYIEYNNYYQIVTDANGRAKIDFLPNVDFVGEIEVTFYLGVGARRPDKNLIFVTIEPEVTLPEADLSPMDGMHLIPASDNNESFTVMVPESEGIASTDIIVITAALYDANSKKFLSDSPIFLLSQAVGAWEYGRTEKDFSIKYAALINSGEYELVYTLFEPSGNARASMPTSFIIDVVPHNVPDPNIDSKRVLNMPLVKDCKGTPIPYKVSYVNENSIGTTGLSISFPIGAPLVVNSIVKATVYLNGYVSGLQVQKQYTNVFDRGGTLVSEHQVTDSDIQSSSVAGKIPLDALVGWDSPVPGDGSIYIELHTDDNTVYSKYWTAFLDTVPPGEDD